MNILESARARQAGKLAVASAAGAVVESLESRTLFTTFGATVAQENALPGTPESTWDLPVPNGGDPTLQGYATDMSVNPGQTISFKVNDSQSAPYTINIYRLGYYQGNGARLITTIGSSQTLRQVQPAPLTNTTTGLVDAGNWAVSGSWSVPTDALSGVYIADLVRTDTGGMSQIVFVVRNDASHSDLLFKVDDATWEAYNQWGNGNSFYTGSSVDGSLGTATTTGGNSDDAPTSRAVEASYNRPFSNRGQPHGYGADSQIFYAEYPMIRWLEANGYDVSYTTDVDTSTAGYATIIEQHKAFMSVGHDEYWSGNERANVQSARDAGVNLAFLSGNSVYWKTYYINSTANNDGTDQNNRVLVSFKESWANSVIDSTNPNIWTGTWMDPRFSPPADGGQPQNALTGTLFGINTTPDTYGEPLSVPSTDAGLRFWRNTAVASLKAGQSALLGDDIVGYEADLDVDNGFRPAGLMDLSSTAMNAPQVLADDGSVTQPAAVTHSITLYRASSGALVFSAATVQWSWGLDGDHDGVQPVNVDPAIQQATVNLLADMFAQPSTLQAGLVPASASTDTTPPTSAITSPSTNAVVVSGTPVTITGTAADAGGGVIAGVEISTDGGQTWHPVTGTATGGPRFATWTYTWVPGITGPVNLRTRAVDDSGNLETPSAGVSVTVNLPTAPISLFASNSVPTDVDSKDGSAVELGFRFTSDLSGFITGIRFYKASTNTGTHIGNLWTNTGTLLASATFTNETASGWQQVTFSQPVPITAGTVYVASYFAPNGHYSDNVGAFSGNAINNGPLHGVKDSAAGRNGVYVYGTSAFPSNPSLSSSNYWVDVVFASPNQLPPMMTSQSPGPNATGVPVASPVTLAFSKSIQPSNLSIALISATGQQVATTINYDPATFTVTVQPNASLATDTVYSASLSDSADGLTPTTWSFTTAPSYTLWGLSKSPVNPSATDSASVNVGTEFHTDSSGDVTGVRFYKGAGNTGTHIAGLWTTSGQLLASATFTNETSTGWQQVNFGSPVAVSANTNYVVSYLAPAGHYAVDPGYFASTGVDDGPLHANSVTNGWYAYSSSLAFPSATFNSSNYWVDVVFGPSALSVTSEAPAPNSNSVSTSSTAAVTFSENVNASSISFVLQDANGNIVPSSVSYNPTTFTATLTPNAALNSSTTYTATVSGATDSSGNVMTGSVKWSFTTVSPNNSVTIWPGTATPAVASANDTSPIEVGVKIRSDVAGFITGVRFYKGSLNTGTHVAHLWTSTGALLASATFTNETASGWEQANFAPPVAIAANTTYIASYYAPVGGYAYTAAGFATTGADNAPLHALANGVDGSNGVFVYGVGGGFPTNSFNSTNYWVDVAFTTAAAGAAPTVVSASPSAGATGVGINGPVTVTFGAPVQASTISLVVTDANGASVAGTVAYDSASQTATLTPTSILNTGATYTVTVSGAQDSSGNTMVPVSWSFTTAAAVSIWNNSATPGTASISDSTAVEVGMKFRSDTAGTITGVRFYKGTLNTGTHVAHLWTSAGVLLATATFSNETGSGWQQVNFASPVGISANTTYIVSYYAPAGGYAYTSAYFASAGVDAVPLHALGNGVDGSNGVFAYGPLGTFPTSSFNSTNYWVDVLFSSTMPASPPTVVATSPAAGSTGIAISSSVAATFSSPVQLSTISFVLKDSNGNTVPGNVTYNITTQTATLTPASALMTGTTYTVTVSGATDASGDVMSPTSWSFTTTPFISAWNNSASPAVTTVNDTSAAELGVKFSTDVAGSVLGIRFYKGSLNTGTHTGELWDGNGNLLATGTFTGESASGWQTLMFTTAVPISANTLYIASYFAPSGQYSADASYFGSTGVDNGPLHILSNTAAGGNGVFAYGSTRTFPNSSFNSTNYWVDVLFADGTNAPPTVISQAPAAGLSGVSSGTSITATFSESVVPSTIQMAVTGPGGTMVTGSISYDSLSHTATFTPSSALASLTTYSVTISGAQDLSGNVMTAPYSWSFTTKDTTPPTVTSFTPANGATGVAVSVTPTVTFSKAMNVLTLTNSTVTLTTGGTSVPAALSYNSTSNLLTVTPNNALANATSYTVTILGGASGVADASGNTLASSVSWSFTTIAAVPTVTSTAPASGATTIATNVQPTVTFSTAMLASSVNTSTIQITNGGTVVSATVSYNSATNTATITSSAALASGTTYTVTVLGGTSGVQSAAGLPLAVNFTFTFTTNSPLVQTTIADFTTGTNSGTSVAPTGNGAVTLAVGPADQFTGTTISTGTWSQTNWPGQTASVTDSGGIAIIKGADLTSVGSFALAPVEARVTFAAVANQFVGFANAALTSTPTNAAGFVTNNTALLAKTIVNGVTTTVSLGTTYLGAYHVFRVVPKAASVQFLVDGTVRATINKVLPSGSYRLALSSQSGSGTALRVDYVNTLYPSSGTFVSSVLDATRAATWGTVSWTATVPTGTTVTVKVRTGNTATPDGTWTAWTTATNGSTPTVAAGRYLQYEVIFTTTDPSLTPVLNDISFNWN